MERVGVRELRVHASTYVDRAARGETLEITKRGEVVAVLAPSPHRWQDVREQLIRTGQLVPGTGDVRDLPPPTRLRSARRCRRCGATSADRGAVPGLVRVGELVALEPESSAVRAHLAGRPEVPLVSSAVTRVEVVRTVALADATLRGAAVALCERLDLVPVSLDLLRESAEVPPSRLPSLEAIHLATALRLRWLGLQALVTYDLRLADAARAADLPVVAPS